MQPAAGAHGELTGMMVIRACLESRGNARKKVLIPDSAHGTNPASCTLCGYTTVPVVSDEHGCIDPKAVAELMDEQPEVQERPTRTGRLALLFQHRHYLRPGHRERQQRVAKRLEREGFAVGDDAVALTSVDMPGSS